MMKRQDKKSAQIVRVILQITEKYPRKKAPQTIPVNCKEIANDIDRLAGSNSRSKIMELELDKYINNVLLTENEIEIITSVLDQRNKRKFAVNSECILMLIQF